MCNWCKKETIGIPQISSASIPMICEHCGTSINKRLSHNNARKWASEFIASQALNTTDGDKDALADHLILEHDLARGIR